MQVATNNFKIIIKMEIQESFARTIGDFGLFDNLNESPLIKSVKYGLLFGGIIAIFNYIITKNIYDTLLTLVMYSIVIGIIIYIIFFIYQKLNAKYGFTK